MGNSCRRRQQEPPAVSHTPGFGYRQGGAISRAAAIKSIKAEKKSVSVQTEPAGALVVRPTPRGTDRLEYEFQIAKLVRAGREDLEEFARAGWLEPRRTNLRRASGSTCSSAIEADQRFSFLLVSSRVAGVQW